jgi:hypothetical protein
MVERRKLVNGSRWPSKLEGEKFQHAQLILQHTQLILQDVGNFNGLKEHVFSFSRLKEEAGHHEPINRQLRKLENTHQKFESKRRKT